MDAAESKVEALRRELNEELGVTVDESKPVYYLGGWSQSKARDNLVNDSFCAFAVTLKDKKFSTDHKEIFEARWFPINQLRSLLAAQVRPFGKRVPVPELGLPKSPPANSRDDGERNVVQGNVLLWVDAMSDGRCQLVVTKDESRRPGEMAQKATWGMVK